jgi:hypothetical protein
MSTTGHGSGHGSGSGTAQDELWLKNRPQDSSRMFLPRMDSSRMDLPRKYLSRKQTGFF